MDSLPRFAVSGIEELVALWDDGGQALCRGWRHGIDGQRVNYLVALEASEHTASRVRDRLVHEYSLRDYLDGSWAARPLELLQDRARTALVLEDPGGESLSSILGTPVEIGTFLPIAISIAEVIGKMHRQGLVHKDIRPHNILVSTALKEVHLTGFGIASRLDREKLPIEPTDTIDATLAYMAPERTGRMNRAVDQRSDLYSLGVTLYELLTGTLPFTASDPAEWIYCHIARRPDEPFERVDGIPTVISSIVMRLLEKTAEERYQTAIGVEADLRHCLNEWQNIGRIEEFSLGSRDGLDRFAIPETLYGREREIHQLHSAFERVVATRRPELILVAGPAGVGKSSVANELQKALSADRGMFASGKFDQNRRTVPYSPFAEAFRQLVNAILAKPDAELLRYRKAIEAAVEPYGQLVVNLIPELERVIGKQRAIEDLAPSDARRVFAQVLQRFIGVFARPESPLVLFLDDLQWLDVATLDVVQHLLLSEDVKDLLFVGACRDDEIDLEHPLTNRLDLIRNAGVPVTEIKLAPLALSDVRALIADTLHDVEVLSLAELVYDKTAGNPLFTTQFLGELAAGGLIALEAGTLRWTWDSSNIAGHRFSDNIVELMIAKIARLPACCREAMQAMACIGNTARVETLAAALVASSSDVQAAARHAIDAGLVRLQGDTYAFLHDRVQEASYCLIAEADRPSAHLRLGRHLLARTPTDKLDENVFDIVNQLNLGVDLVSDRDELDRIAELNAKAGRRAKAATAYGTALSFLQKGAVVLGAEGWKRCRLLAFALDIDQGECEFLTGNLKRAETRLSALPSHAAGLVELAAVASLRIMLHVTRGESARSVEICLEYLEHEGIRFASHPSRKEVEEELDRMWQALGSRSIEDLALLPETTDAATQATMDVLAATASPAWFTDQLLPAMLGARMVNISIERGNGPASSFGYAVVAMKLGPISGDYRTAYRFGKLALELAERSAQPRTLARVLFGYAMFVRPWADNLDGCRELLYRGVEAAERSGDATYAAYLLCNVEELMLIAGTSLDETEAACRRALEYIRKLNFDFVGIVTRSHLGLTRMLRGGSAHFGSFNSPEFDQEVFERTYGTNPALALPMCAYWINRQQALFLAGDSRGSAAAASAAEPLLWCVDVHFKFAEHHFYAALARAACLDGANEVDRPKLHQALEANLKKLAVFGENSPVTLGSRATLVAAEFARIEGREREAMDFYEEAIRSARAAGFAHIEALGFELAGRFYAERGFQVIALSYRREAREAYRRWGAYGKVEQLDQLYPELAGEPVGRSAAMLGHSIRQLDVASVVKASQAISSEIEMPGLIERLMRIAVENAGADRGLLILPAQGEYFIEAEARAISEQIQVGIRREPITSENCPESIVRYVIRTQETVIIDDASKPNLFTTDDYLRNRQSKSLLCLPLIKQRELAGILLLENALASHAFKADRIATIEILAAQAAISLENTRLYDDLQKREVKLRRIVDSNIIGICIWGPGGRILQANEAFLRIVGYSHDDIGSDRLNWGALATPESREADEAALTELISTGTCRAYEKEYVRKDYSRVPVLVGAATLDSLEHLGVAFALDLTERKQAEEALREAEQRHLDAQMQLAHVNRIATMGELVASIAHEVNQPIGATLVNAGTTLRWLNARPPNLGKARESTDRIIADSKRATDIISRIRDLVKKSPAQREYLNVNNTLLEVIGFTRNQLSSSAIVLRMQMADNLPKVCGDRVQLQQVFLNLIMNAIEAMSELSDRPRDLLIETNAGEPEGVLVEISDSGSGLPESEPARIFEAFYTTKSSGLGMGLSICSSIVNAHGGRLWATARKPHGTVFRLMLPVKGDLLGSADRPGV